MEDRARTLKVEVDAQKAPKKIISKAYSFFSLAISYLTQSSFLHRNRRRE
jgi:hypothetical protein